MKRLSLFKNSLSLLLAVMAFTFFCAAPRAEAQCFPEYGTYCDFGDQISYISFNEINYSSGCEGYSDNTWLSTDLDAGSSYYLYMEVGYSGQAYTVWIDFNDNQTFEDDEMVFSAETGDDQYYVEGDVFIPATAPAGQHRMRVRIAWGETAPLNPCDYYEYGEAEDYSVNIISAGTPNDAAISAISAPVAPFAAGSQNVNITLMNAGSNDLTSATIDWSINGVAQTPYNWSGSLGAGGSTTATLGSYNFVSGNIYTIDAAIVSANGSDDPNAENNSVSTTVTPALNGSYTIGGTNPNFPTFTAAAQTLTAGGVTGAVTFNVRPGTYTEQFTIGMYPNANATRPVTFQSENGVASSVVVQYAATSPVADNYVVRLDAADFITLKSMTLTNTGANYGTVVYILNGADNTTIQGNVLNGRNFPSSAFEDAVIRTPQSGTANNNNLTVVTNTINYGSLGVYIWGHSSTTGLLSTGLRIENNTIQNAYAGTILMDYVNGVTIANNTLIGSPTGRLVPGGYAVRVRSSDGDINIEKNKINSFIGGRGIVSEGVFTGTGRARITNNFIEMGAGTANDADGINVLRSNVDVFNNTVNITSTLVTSPTGSSDALDIGSFTSVDVRNNILIARNGRAVNAVTTTFGTSNYNNLYTTGPVLVNAAGVNYANLAAWQATGKDVNSVSFMPMFASSTNLHLTAVDTRLFGTATTTTDIDNETRRNAYMGADEVIPTITITAQPAASAEGCRGLTTVLSVNASSTFNSVKSYQWQKNGAPIFDNQRITGTTTPTLTILNTQPSDAGVYAVRITDNSGATPVTSQVSDVVVNGALEIVRQPVSGVVCTGTERYALSVIADGTIRRIQWQKESATSASGYVDIPGATTAQIFLTNINYGTAGKYRAMLYGTCGTDSMSSKVATVFVASTTFIAKQVENSYAGIGGTATLSVDPEVSGTTAGSESYQWYRNGVALSDDTRINGSSSSVLTISNLQPSDTSATYYAMVTGACGTAQSNTARITVLSLAITAAPEAVEACPGATATMSVTAESATAGAQLSYQWMRNGKALNNGGNISGATSSTLTIANAGAADVYSDYRVRVTSQPGDVVVMSSPVALTLGTATAITTQPTEKTICEGEALDLNVAASGSTLSYEWRLNGTAVTGATAADYSVASATPAMSGLYTVVVKGTCGEVTSSEVNVTVKAKPTFTTQPQDVDQNQFNDLTLTAAATGEGTLTYQWYKDGVAIPGATSATYTKPGSTPDDRGTYYVEVTGECGMTKSAEADVTITTGMEDHYAAGYSLEATTPSPVTDKATISFTLANSEFTRIVITDMFGREVAVLVNGFTEQGTKTATFSASELKMASGIYIYTISTPTFQLSKQLVVVR